MAEESTRTKMIRETQVDDDMPFVKKAVRSVTLGASKLADKLGFTQEREYGDKSKEELAVKKRAGGRIKKYEDGGDVELAKTERMPYNPPRKPKGGKTVYVKRGGTIDGIAIRGKTRAKLK